MALFFKACGAALLTAILMLALGNQTKDLSVAFLAVVCCMLGLAALQYIKPVLEFVERLEQLGGIRVETLEILLKAAGIGYLAEIAALICSDAGSSSLGKGIQFLGAAVILWLSIPLFTMLLDLLEKIMGEL